ncbi:hypothetical protein KCU64_g17711, partial [Aureobasidium melanogenum]
MYQPSRLRPGTPHSQSGRGLFQPRHHPYAASQSRPSQYPSPRYLQATLPASSPGDMGCTPSRSDTPAQNHLPAASQIQTPKSQEFLRYLQEFQQTQGSRNTSQPKDQIRSQTMSPSGKVYSPAQLHVGYVSQSSTVEFTLLLAAHHRSAAQQADAQESYSGVGMPFPSDSDPITEQNTATRATHTTSSAAAQQLDLRTVTYPSLPLQAQSEEESNHPHQKTLVGKTQERALANIRPHAFIGHLTMDHNACFKPKVARVFDMLFMQALLFYKDNVFLVSPKVLQTPCWEPPQSIWHACDLHRPEAVSPVQVEKHIYKALNLFSDLQPDEVVCCVNHGRHDSAVNIVRNNGKLTYGWSVALSFEFKNETYASRFRNVSPDLNVALFSENKIKDLNMDPVWKAKVLEIFSLRRDS